jgi:hypothetical protein
MSSFLEIINHSHYFTYQYVFIWLHYDLWVTFFLRSKQGSLKSSSRWYESWIYSSVVELDRALRFKLLYCWQLYSAVIIFTIFLKNNTWFGKNIFERLKNSSFIWTTISGQHIGCMHPKWFGGLEKFLPFL